MKPQLWQAIDRIGNRPASRYEWENVSGLTWEDLREFLLRCPDSAREVPDPDHNGEMLAVWPGGDGNVVLESQVFPAHRPSFAVESDAVTLYRPHLTNLAAALAPVFGFIARPAPSEGDLHRIGFVQAPGAPTVDVLLLLARFPTSAREAVARLARHPDRRVIMLLPTGRILSGLPSVPESVEARVMVEFLAENEDDSLTSVAASSTPKLPLGKASAQKVLQVRQEDRWASLQITVDPAEGIMILGIGRRHLKLPLLDVRRKPTRAAQVLGRILKQAPHHWTVTGLRSKDQGPLRQMFIRFQRDLKRWAPIPDGKPFDYHPQTRCHYPRFRIRLQTRPTPTSYRSATSQDIPDFRNLD